jgi:hypothetical protein
MDEFWIFLDKYAPSITPLRRYSTAAGAMEAAENECVKTGIDQVVLKADRYCKREVTWHSCTVGLGKAGSAGIKWPTQLTKEEVETLLAKNQAMMAGQQFNPPKEY